MRKFEGYTEEELAAMSEEGYVQSAVTIGSGNATQLGSDIPDKKVRYIWYLEAVADDGTDQNLGVYAGDSGNNQRTTLLKTRVPDVTGGAEPLVLGGDPTKPLITVIPSYGSSTTGNQVRVAHETSAINVKAKWFDLPA